MIQSIYNTADKKTDDVLWIVIMIYKASYVSMHFKILCHFNFVSHMNSIL